MSSRRLLGKEGHLLKTTIILVTILLLTLASQNSVPIQADQLVPSLITASFGYDSGTFDKFKAHGVNWIVIYGSFDSGTIPYIHSLGMKALVYVTALKEPPGAKDGIWNGYETIIPDQSWAQYDGSQYLYPGPGPIPELWFSPYGPYIDDVVIPRMQKALELGADGIFLDTLILYPDADQGEYARQAWETKYGGGYGIEFGSLEFRYLSLVDAAEKIYNALRSMNSEAILIINDNNVCIQSPEGEIITRNKFASAIDRWQNYADGFLLEYTGAVEDNYPQDPYAEIDAIINVWNRERTQYGVQKPIWILAHTNRDDLYQYMKGKSIELGFGYWTWSQYLMSKTVTTTQSTQTTQTTTETTVTQTTATQQTIASTTISYDGGSFELQILTNSQVSNFNFDQNRRLINFTVTGADDTTGYCNVTIAKELLDGDPVVLIDNVQVASTIIVDEEYYYIYFTFQHSSKNVCIGGVHTIPEFKRLRSILIIALVLLPVSALILKRIRNQRALNGNNVS